MTTMSSQVMLARLDRLDRVMKFFAQCPASKRGKPMDPGQAIHQEKKNPGSVCMKVSRARDGRGQRHVFYKVTSRAEKAAQKAKQNPNQEAQPQKKAKPVTPVEMLKRKAAAIAPSAAKKAVPGTPSFHSGVEGLSEKQQRWGKIFHHQLERSLRSYIGSISESAPAMKPYAQEAWQNLMQLGTAGAIFGLKGLDGSRLFWSLLTPESAKKLAASTGMNLAVGKDDPLFSRVMRSKFKDDPSFREAMTSGKAWPSAGETQSVPSAQEAPKPEAAAPKVKPLDAETKAHAEEMSRSVENNLLWFGRQIAMGETNHGPIYAKHLDEAMKNLKAILHPKTLAGNLGHIARLNDLTHDPEKLFLKLLSPETLEQIKLERAETKRPGKLARLAERV